MSRAFFVPAAGGFDQQKVIRNRRAEGYFLCCREVMSLLRSFGRRIECNDPAQRAPKGALARGYDYHAATRLTGAYGAHGSGKNVCPCHRVSVCYTPPNRINLLSFCPLYPSVNQTRQRNIIFCPFVNPPLGFPICEAVDFLLILSKIYHISDDLRRT